MKLTDKLKNGALYFVPVIAFIVLSYIYFSQILEGMELPQMDNTHAAGMAKELVDYEKEHPGEVPLWTNSMFGGMPAYQIKTDTSHSIFYHLNHIVQNNLPYSTVAIVFLYMLGFYILLISLKVDKWLSMAGAIGFAFASYNIIIIIAGHITKAYAIGMMAPVIAGVILLYRKQYIGGGLLTLIALGSEIAMNHVQITYYLGMMVLVYVIAKLIEAIREKQIPHFVKASVILGIAAFLAVAPNSTNLLTTYEYGKESIRGETELKNETVKKSSGLDKDYALSWSYGKKETLNLMIPNAVGGESGMIGNVGGALDDVKQEYQQAVAQQNQYWGEMPFTSGPVYIGAIICFLFILGLFYIDGTIKWWLLAATVLSIFLAWGKNMEWFTDIFFYYFPLYNKFRTVSMILVIAGLAMPLLAMLTLKKIFEKPEILKERAKEFYIALGITGGLSLVFYLIPGALLNFLSSQEAQGISQQMATITDQSQIRQFNEFVAAIETARISIFKADAIRSFAFVALAALVLWLYCKKILQKPVFIAAFVVLFFTDMWPIAKRYLNADDFVPKRTAQNQFIPSKADEFIFKYKETDPNADLNFRVFNISRNPFTEVNTSYFHHSIGGYHGAKLRRYQDVIDSILVVDFQRLRSVISAGDSTNTIYKVLANAGVLNMLNTKYIIYDPGSMPVVNFNALGNVWFVDDYKIVDNPNEELAAIKDDFNPASTAIIDKRFEKQLSTLKTEKTDSLPSLIKLMDYKPHHLTYQVNTRKPELAVFSEIYYDKGWNAYLNGKKVDYMRADYILRAMVIPEGKFSLEFKFEPSSYKIGQVVSTTSSIIIVLLVLGFAVKYILDEMKKQKEQPKVQHTEAKTEAKNKKKQKKRK